MNEGEVTRNESAASRHAVVPPPPAGMGTSGRIDTVVETLVPYRNGYALAAYYLGIFSLIPCAGLFLGAAAVITGILGLRLARQRPEVRGKVHAWVGIVLGGLIVLLHFAVIAFGFLGPLLYGA
ncbi:MAG: DUF4190 domain-containing protein [Candidatus Hydrogenedentes bacterium]|nr:DUF4190 domain-containing protein [Candidatus Hydrogenedentota bacterium]